MDTKSTCETKMRCCGADTAPEGQPKHMAWNSMAEWYPKWVSPGTAMVTFSLFGHLGLLNPGSAPMRVIETHAGDAKAAGGLLPTPAVGSYTVTDFSPGMLEVAKAGVGEHATVVTANATALPFSDASFDRYLSNLGMCCTPDLTAKVRTIWALFQC